jgi:hypothetical protein
MNNNNMNTATLTNKSKMYTRLFNHCQNQYKNIREIKKAYIKKNQVFGIEYIATSGVCSIPYNTYDADKVIIFTF